MKVNIIIRLWNYNKSRIHSYRGAKEVTILLDSTVIFKGEVARACGGLAGGTEAYGDTILFTENEEVLDQVRVCLFYTMTNTCLKTVEFIFQ